MADSTEHTSIITNISISVRDRQTWEYSKDGKTSHFISFFTDATNLIGFIITIDDEAYRIFKVEEAGYGFRAKGVRV